MARKTPKMEISIATDVKTGSSTRISSNRGVHNGTVFFAKIIIPSYEEDVTTDINLVDEGDDIVYTFSDLSRGATHIITDFQCPLVEQEYFTAELSDEPGGDADYMIYVTLYYIPDVR